jgi:hypothetical protein
MTVKKKSVKKASVKKAVTKKKAGKKAPIKRKPRLEVDEYGLNHKEHEFADHWRGGVDEVRGNAKRSYMKVYPRASEKTAEVEGSKLLRLPKIDSYLRMKADDLSEKADINAEWVLNQAVKVHEMCMQVSPVLNRKGEQIYIETPDGEEVPAFTFNAVGANKSLELVGKHVSVKAFEGDKDKGVNITVVIEDKDSQA